MDQQKQKLKIPCDHPLRYASMETASREYYYQAGEDYGMPYECQVCNEQSGYIYYCPDCSFGAHEDCIDFPETINHPCHSRHLLKIVSPRSVDYIDGQCHLCGNRRDRMYHCSLCNFTIDVECWRTPPPLTINQPKSHNHSFTLMPIKVSFTCNACGIVGERNPYVCIECGYMLHRDCIALPRVININRHDHRVSRSYHLGHGDWESCGVCRKEIDWSFGAFSCKRCPNYAVHSKCATREDVWDGIELEDNDEEEEEILDPYIVVNEEEIIHFSHQHNLRIGDIVVTNYENKRCDACNFPINSDQFFKCVQCEFFLHKVCASLPRKNRNITHVHKLTLEVNVDDSMATSFFRCNYCSRNFDGFRYTCNCTMYYEIDVRCGSISEPFHHELHPHPLYRTSARYNPCGVCGKKSEFLLNCIVCEFSLGMECATLPRKVKHRCDDHFLSLHHGAGNSTGQLWCDICEGKTDPSIWYYGCDECGVTLHTKCVLGDLFYMKQGKKYFYGELVSNNGMTRPFCFVCEQRCVYPFIFKGISAADSTFVYACSMNCAFTTSRPDLWSSAIVNSDY